MRRARRRQLDVHLQAQVARQLAMLLGCGMPLDNALALMRDDARSGLAAGFDQLRQRLRAGVAPGPAVRQTLPQMGEEFARTLQVGQHTGALDRQLEELARALDERQRIRQRLRQAMRVPGLSLVAILAGGLLIGQLVLPRLEAVYARSGLELPLASRLVLALRPGMPGGDVLLMAIGILALMGLLWLRTSAGRRMHERMMAELPLVREFWLRWHWLQLFGQLHRLLGAGVPLRDALQLLREDCSVFWQSQLHAVLARIDAGCTFWESLADSRYFSQTIVQMVRSGEQSARLEWVAGRIAAYMHEELDLMGQRLSAVAGPLLLGVAALMLAGLAMAIFVPLWSMLEVLNRG